MRTGHLLLSLAVLSALTTVSASGETCFEKRTSNPITIESQIREISLKTDDCGGDVQGDHVLIRLYRQPYDIVAGKWLRVETTDGCQIYARDLQERDNIRLAGDLDHAVVYANRIVLQRRERHIDGECPRYVTNKADAFVIAVVRSAGFTPAQTKATDYYKFTVARNGNWEFKPQFKGQAKNGKLGADDLDEWVKDIEDGGFYDVKSNPELGSADEPYMDITVNGQKKTTHLRIRLAEKLSQAIEKKIVELVTSGR